MPKRKLRVASLLTKEQFARLQAKWDARLKRSGFVDIEYGQDLNDIPGASTFRRRSDGGHGTEVDLGFGFEVENALGNGEPMRSFSDDETAETWRYLCQAAHAIDDSDKDKRLICVVAETGFIAEAAKITRAPIDRISRAWHKFCDRLGVSTKRLRASRHPRATVDAPNPAPVRMLSRDEIARLNYRPPKQIKDSSK